MNIVFRNGWERVWLKSLMHMLMLFFQMHNRPNKLNIIFIRRCVRIQVESCSHIVHVCKSISVCAFSFDQLKAICFLPITYHVIIDLIKLVVFKNRCIVIPPVFQYFRQSVPVLSTKCSSTFEKGTLQSASAH